MIGLDNDQIFNVWDLQSLKEVLNHQITTSTLPLLWSLQLNKKDPRHNSLEIVAADEYQVYISYVGLNSFFFVISLRRTI